MNLRYIFTFSIGLALVFSLSLCTKENQTSASTFYGHWKTSYGDTITFSRENGKNIVEYDQSMSPSVPRTDKYEYTFKDGKLAIKDGMMGTPDDFRIYRTFAWIEEGKSFTIQGLEWFAFISSTITYFTFTKIP
ncbi:MAG: hypothetical protein WDN26_17070 [Chitinophagaceae bacterium]